MEAQTISNQSILTAIKNESDDLRQSENSISFPVSAMPLKMQTIIHGTSKGYGFNIDYIVCAFLSAFASCIGSTYKVKVKGTWYESAILFMVLIGRPGVNKTAPVRYAYQPIDKKDSEDFKEYRRLLKDYKIFESAKNAKNAESASIDKPVRQQRIISDSTIEALCSVLSFNRRGISVVIDEVAGLFKNFNRYNNGSDQEFWLQVWSNITVSINRKNDESILIDNPFISMIGTIQPNVLNEIYKDGRSENGFIDRILFTYPDINLRPAFHFNEPDESFYDEYNTIIKRLLLLDFNDGVPNVLQLSESAKIIYQQWSQEQALTLEENNNDRLGGIFAKIEVYVFRFSLIYQLLSWACEESDKFEIEDSAMHSAIETAEYFKKMALKVNPISNEIKIPMGKQRQEIYKDLPKQFTTAEGVAISLKHKLPERTFKEWLNNDTVFIKEKHGIYSKVL